MASRAGENELGDRASAIADRIAHRGPDAAGVWQAPGAALAHRRLAILDPSPSGNQPMLSDDGRWVVAFNGIIYNHQELRTGYGGAWRSDCDTETLLRLLQEEGIAGVPNLVGMFAFAAWDREGRTLFLVRDRIGIKPLYYLDSGTGLAFASEAHALSAVSPQGLSFDTDSAASYFALGYPPLRRTLFAGVYAVLPGEIVEYQMGELRRSQYWQLPERCDHGRTVDEWQEEFSDLWGVVTNQHLLSDVPVGLFLSGGMDSSAVAIALGQSEPPPRVFSARFAEPEFDESKQAKELCADLDLEYTEIPVDFAEVERILPGVARHSDLPVADSSMIGTWLLCEKAATEVKVVLSGDGGDEVFAGYLTHRATEMLGSPLGVLPRLFSAAFWRWIPAPRTTTERISFSQKATRFLRHARHGPLGAHLRWRTLVTDRDLRDLLALDVDPWDQWNKELERYPHQSLLNRALAFDVQNYLVQDELVRADRMSMAHGLEVRVPFLDHRVVEMAFRMPYEVKGGSGNGKLPVARWLEQQGYGAIARRPKKGFNHPLAAWFKGLAADRVLDLAGGSALSAMLSQPLLEAWVRAHQSGKEDRGYELWSALVLLEWGEAHHVRL